MSDLISRSHFDERVRAAVGMMEDELSKDFKDGVLATLTLLESEPPAERKKGHWIRHPEQKNIYGGKYIECSECGEKYLVQYIEDEKFCRSCGADMRGENNGEH